MFKRILTYIVSTVIVLNVFGANTPLAYPTSTGAVYNGWTNPTDAYSNNGVRAYVLYTAMPQYQDWGTFSIPDLSGNTITGIALQGEMRNNNSAGTSIIYFELSWDGGSTWSSTGYNSTATAPWVDTTFTLGGASDLWGRGSWTSSELSNANFLVRGYTTNGGSIWTTDLDYVAITVYYDGVATPPSDTLWCDPVTSDVVNDGTQAHPYKTSAQLSAGIEATSSNAVIMIADTILEGTFSLTNVNGSLGNEYIFDVWKLYGHDHYTFSGLKTLGTFTSIGGNMWRITDTDLTGNYKDYAGYDAPNYIMSQFLVVDNKAYGVSRYPNTGYLTAESWSAADPATYIHDNTLPTSDDEGATITATDESWGVFKYKASISGGNYNVSSGTASVDMSTVGDWNNTGYGWWLKYVKSNLEYYCDANGDFAYDHSSHRLSVYWDSDLNSHTVQYPNMNYVIDLNNCSYLTFRNMKIVGGNVAQLYAQGGSNIAVDSSHFLFTPGWAAVLTIYTNNVTVTNSTFKYGTGGGINSKYISNFTATGNVFKDLATHDVMIPDQLDGCAQAISLREPTGDIVINHNYSDSTGSAAWLAQLYVGGITKFEMNYNIVTNAMLVLNDGGGEYVFESIASADAITKYIRGNYVANCPGNAGFNYNGVADANNIYFDGDPDYFQVDSNVVMDGTTGLYLHGGNHITIEHNTFYSMNDRLNNTGTKENAAGIKFTEWGHYGGSYPSRSNTVRYNDFIVRDSTYEHPIYWLDTDASLNPNSNYVDYNYYKNPFAETPEYTGATVANWSSLTRRNRAGMYSVLGFQQHATYNSPDWSFQDVSGITRDQFVRIYYSDTAAHVFNLGSAVFQDLSGNEVSGTLTLDAGKSKVLLYKSGSLVSLDDPVYISLGQTPAWTPSPSTIVVPHYGGALGGTVVFHFGGSLGPIVTPHKLK